MTKDPSVTAHFTWEKDNNAINNQRMTVQADGSLVISSVRDTDAGSYVCTVKSIVGNDTTSTTLIVQGMASVPRYKRFLIFNLIFVSTARARRRHYVIEM